MKRVPVFIVTALLVALAVLLFYKYRVAPKINFAGIELTDLDGKAVSLQDFKNKERFINFFATWCGPCIKEMPALNQTALALRKDDFVIICISDEPVERIRFLHDRNPDLVILHSVKKFRDLKIATLPTSYILNGQSEITFEKVGELKPLTRGDLEGALRDINSSESHINKQPGNTK